MVRKIFLLIIVTMIAVPVYAQRQNDLPSNYAPVKSSFSLLNPDRFRMSHSYSIMYSSSRRGSSSLGMYLNSIEYQVSDPLKIKLDIGYIHQPGSFFNSNSNTLKNGKILPSISIDWKPLKNLYLQFNYQQVPSFYYYTGGGLDNIHHYGEEEQ